MKIGRCDTNHIISNSDDNKKKPYASGNTAIFDTLEKLAACAISVPSGGECSCNTTVYTSGNCPKHDKYKYCEDEILNDFREYIDATYSQHYKSQNKEIECFDAWIALGDATPTFRNTALKYLWRYGKKGDNKQDLFKALHYVMLMLYNDHYKGTK